jgi:hypothetical protein
MRRRDFIDSNEESKMTTKGKVLVLVSSGHGLPLKDGKVYAGAGYYLNPPCQCEVKHLSRAI